jgi:protein TonB
MDAMTRVDTSDPFDVGQWAIALSLALVLHLLLAWVLLRPEPRSGEAAVARGAGLRVTGIDSGAVQPTALTDAATGLPVLADAAPALLQPVEPPTARAMVEPAPAPLVQSTARAARPESTTRQRETNRGTQEPAARSGSGQTPPRRSLARSGGSKAGEVGTGRGAKDSGGSDRSAVNASRGIDRAAAPLAGNPHPRYPTQARSRGHEGRVLIQVSVLGNGRVGSARVASSSGHGSLDRAALKAVKRWRFRPALRGGKPVAATLTVPVVFRLEG